MPESLTTKVTASGRSSLRRQSLSLNCSLSSAVVKKAAGSVRRACIRMSRYRCQSSGSRKTISMTVKHKASAARMQPELRCDCRAGPMLQTATQRQEGALMSDLASKSCVPCRGGVPPLAGEELKRLQEELGGNWQVVDDHHLDRKSTRLNSSHVSISYAVFLLKTKI